MKPEKDKSIYYALIVYALLTCGALWSHVRIVERPQEGMRHTLHREVIEKRAGAPMQYRFLSFYAAEGLQRAGVSFDNSYIAIRWIFTFLVAAAFHIYMLRWFRPEGAFIGTLFFFAVLPSTYFQYFMQPHDLPNLFFFILGLMLIRDRRDMALPPLLFVAMLNRETIVLLIFVYIFYRHDELSLQTLVMRAFGMFLSCVVAYALTRTMFGERQYQDTDFIFLMTNTVTFASYAGIALVLGVFAVVAWPSLSRRPKFMARALALVPFFFIIHWTCTRILESRLLLPLIPAMIPPGLVTMFGERSGILRHPDAPRLDASPIPAAPDHFSTRHPAAAMGIVFGGFLAVFVIFCDFNIRNHLGERNAYRLINDAVEAEKAGDKASAEKMLVRAVELAPELSRTHMSLGIFYLQNGNYKMASRYLKRAMDLDPDGPDAARIVAQLEALRSLAPRNEAGSPVGKETELKK